MATDFIHHDGIGREIDWRRLTDEAPIEEVMGYLASFDSYKRSEVVAWVLYCTRHPERCLRIFLGCGSVCDAPWPYRSMVAGALRGARAEVNLLDVLEPAARDFYVALPGLVPVWRGCERGRERGLHWTTDRTVAEGFAQGRRCINPNPTLVHAEIPKQHIFAVLLDRQEHEIVLDPRRLRKLSKGVVAQEPPQPSAGSPAVGSRVLQARSLG
jgi:hypothetical protein